MRQNPSKLRDEREAKRGDCRLLGKHHAMESFVRLGQLGKPFTSHPIEAPTIHDNAPSTVPCPQRNLVAEW